MTAILLLIIVLAAANVEAVETSEYKMDLVFIVDGSDSVCGGDKSCPGWGFTLQFIHKFAEALTIGSGYTKFALIKYGDVTTTEWNLNRHMDKTSLCSAIDNVTMPGGEFNNLGIVSTNKLVTEVFNVATGDRLDATNVAIIITDGMPGYDPKVLGDLAKLFQLAGVKFFVVCVAPNCSRETATDIASPPKAPCTQTSFFVDDYSTIDSVRVPLLKQVGAMLAASKPTLLEL